MSTKSNWFNITEKAPEWLKNLDLPDHLIDRAAGMATDDWDEVSEIDDFFNSITDPLELHIYADFVNWGCGVGSLLRVIKHPLCDLGTGKTIYWRGEPMVMRHYKETSESNETCALLNEIVKKAEAGGFKSNVVDFDPSDDWGDNRCPDAEEIEEYGELPKCMY